MASWCEICRTKIKSGDYVRYKKGKAHKKCFVNIKKQQKWECDCSEMKSHTTKYCIVCGDTKPKK